MSTTVSARRLLGRRSECAALDQLVASVRAGLSRSLVLRGDAGVGKSALLEYLAQHSSGCGIARAAGVESEMELAYAGLPAAVRAVPGSRRAPSRPAARCAWHRVRSARRRSAGSVPRRPGGPEPALRRRGRPTPRLHRGRRAVARRGLGTGAGVRRAPSRCRVGRAGLRRARAAAASGTSRGWRSSPSSGWMTVMRTSYSRPWSPVHLTSACVIGSWPKRTATRWRCSSCHAA